MNKGSNAFRLFWAAVLSMGLLISSSVHQAAAQDQVDEPRVSQPPAQPSPPLAGTTSPGGPPPLPATPPRNAPPPLPTFYIAEGGEPVGPLNMGELQQKVAAGTFTSSTLVWRDGMETWGPAQEVQELSSLFASAGAPAQEEVVEEAAAFDARSFLLGTWHTNGPVPLEGIGMSPADMTANYRQDGSVTLEGVVTANLGMPSPTPITLRSTGTWTVENVNQNRFVLSATLTTTGSAPGVDLSGMEETDTSTGLVEVLGPDSVRDSEGVTWRRVR